VKRYDAFDESGNYIDPQDAREDTDGYWIAHDDPELAALRAVAEAAENAGFGRDGFTAGPLAEAVIRWREAAK